MGNLKEIYSRFFDSTPVQDQQAADNREWAVSCLTVWDQKYFRELLLAIEARAGEPLTIGADLVGMAGAIGRQNGYKEIVKVITNDLGRARRIHDATLGRTEE